MLPAPFRAMDPADDLAWLAVADWLEENDDPARAELTRLTRLLRHDLHGPERRDREDRLMELLNAGVEPCVATLTNSIGMEFVYVPAGIFLMGSPPEDFHRDISELPAHEVEITRGFWMGKYPVTQSEYEAVTGKNPSHFSVQGAGKELIKETDSSRLPIETVAYGHAAWFCRKVGRMDGDSAPKRAYRLPTEAEWEYACRAGVVSIRLYFSGRLGVPPTHNVRMRPPGTPLGQFPPNAFGLHDMPGNLWEWCSDWYARDYDPKTVNKDPSGPPSGDLRVTHGGSPWGEEEFCSVACREGTDPKAQENDHGFRVCFAAPA
jgi:uncharacterized protein (TIGR02996 family)